MMREICAVLRSGDVKGAAPAQAPIRAVFIDDNKKEGHVISGPGCRVEIESIMRGRNARKHAYERAVRVMMTGGIVEEEEEGEVDEGGVKDEWIEKRVTMERFEVSLSKAKAEEGTGVDGWSDYLLKGASKGVNMKYYEVIKEMMVTREFPEEWKEWTATFAMKPGEDPREPGRRKDLWCTCAGQKLVARILGALYEEQAELRIPMRAKEGSRKGWAEELRTGHYRCKGHNTD